MKPSFEPCSRGLVSALVIGVLVIGVASEPAAAGKLEKGVEAFEKEDYRDAYRLLRPLAEKGDPQALFLVGQMYAEGNEVPLDRQRAADLFRRAGSQGHVEAQWHLARMILERRVSGIPSEAAMEWLLKAARQGHLLAQRNLAHRYDEGDIVPRDATEAMTWYERCAEQGDRVCRYQLGNALLEGRGAEADPKAGVALLRRAADAGHPGALTRLGRLHLEGEHVPQDAGLAVSLLTRAAEGDDDDARRILAPFFLEGRHVAADPVRAFALAADLDCGQEAETLVAAALDALGPEQLDRAAAIAQGILREGSYERGFRHVEALAWRGQRWGQLELARLYAHGYGTPCNPSEALFWLSVGATEDSVLALQARESLLPQVARGEVEAIAERVARWQPGPPRACDDRYRRDFSGLTGSEVRLSGRDGVSDPVLVSRISPVYPEFARSHGLQSTVVLRAIIDARGNVLDPVVVSCDEPDKGFEQAALRAVRQWKYEPARKDGEPVAVYFTVIVDFELR